MAASTPPSRIARVRDEHPEIEIELREVDGPKPERLLDGSVDLIVEHQPGLPQGIASRRVGVHHSFLVTPASFQQGTRGVPRMAELAREPFVSLNQGPEQALQLSALRTLHAAPSRITSAPSVTSVLAFVAAGLGYSLIPWPSAQGPRVPGVSTTRLEGKGTLFPVSAAWRKAREPDPVLAAVLRLAPRARLVT